MINNVTLMGRFTRSVELKKTPSGTSVVNFTLAVDRRFSGGGEKKTDFLDCIAWGQTADFISKYFGKGDMIAVIGEVQTREYTGRDGNKKKAVEIVVSNVSFCGGKKSDETAETSDQKDGGFPPFEDMPVIITDDELPF